jgi:serine O-acetyltransferase
MEPSEDSFINLLYEEHLRALACPPPRLVIQFFERLLGALFAEYSDRDFFNREEFREYFHALKRDYYAILEKGKPLHESSSMELSDALFSELPNIREQLVMDIEAMYAGDPAAASKDEVVRTYPGFYAMAAHRIAHAMHLQNIALLPRIISEHAHSKTGIDIHPGASIGTYFCIDHGTGIVIGETTKIGDRVKIYQGVTLGALSVNKSDAKSKRHPTIEDRVVIYAGASILGGETVVGQDSIIGGNVWLTQSVPPNSKIYYRSGDQTLKENS